MTRLSLLLLPLLLAACGTTPPPRLPATVEQARTSDSDARRALTDGDKIRARKYFTKTLALQQSLDDTAGAATTMINLATVAHQLRDDEAALAWLDSILQEKANIYPNGARLTAAFRKAVILADKPLPAEAGAILQVAEQLCEDKCESRFSINVLRARLLVLNGEMKAARSMAIEVGSQAAAGREERANALRVAAAAEESMGLMTDALQHYGSALQLDKALGLSSRIGDDLSGLARVSAKLGHEREAVEYSRRALLVKESSGKMNDVIQ